MLKNICVIFVGILISFIRFSLLFIGIYKIEILKRYHSFTLLASIFKKMNSKIVNPQSPEPP
jgi:uncharacterized membrane protein YgaE (UPF0421/DUF939 family)